MERVDSKLRHFSWSIKTLFISFYFTSFNCCSNLKPMMIPTSKRVSYSNDDFIYLIGLLLSFILSCQICYTLLINWAKVVNFQFQVLFCIFLILTHKFLKTPQLKLYYFLWTRSPNSNVSFSNSLSSRP